MRIRPTFGFASVASLLLVATTADAAETSAASNRSLGTTALHAEIKQRLGTQIDSGWMEKGSIKVRTQFTIDPTPGEPLLTIDMPQGATVEATWSEKGYVNLKPIAGDGAQGTTNVHFTLAPTLSASIYGISVNYNADQLINMIPGASFNYDEKASASLVPWGFAGAQMQAPAPPLDQSTIFSLPFSTLGVDPGIAEGTLSIQASTKPTFKYVTKQVTLEGMPVTSADGVAKVPFSDGDSLDVSAILRGEVTVTGTLDVKPVVQVDTVDGYSTYGLVKFSFSAVSKAYAGTPESVSFDPQSIHIPLPNVKVPTTPIGMGTVSAGQEVDKTVTIANSGEMGAVLRFESSDPQFVVPKDEVKVDSKGSYDLSVAFKPGSNAPASATITVHSNDPDSPDQMFKVGANGASVGDENGDVHAPGEGVPSLPDPGESSGCSFAPARGNSSALGLLGVGLGAALAAARRRRRS